MKKKNIGIILIIVALVVVSVLAGTIPVESKRLICPHPAQTRYSILFGQTEDYNTAQSGPYVPDNGVCWGDLSLYLI